MVDIYIAICFGIIGSILGSFAVASTWRLRAHQLAKDKSDGYKPTKVEKKEFGFIKRLVSNPSAKNRSHCLHCHRQLSALDMVPIFSWLVLGGKCRTCKKPIGYTEFIAEIGLALALSVSYLFWPLPLTNVLDWAVLLVWVLLLLALTIHIVYDTKWLLLLDYVTAIVMFLSIVFVILRFIATGDDIQSVITSTSIALAILPGLYGLLYMISGGAWVGFGDVKLLVPLSIMLPSWPTALLMLFLANFIGFLVLLPGMLSGKVSRASRIPFGPFLILAWFIVMIWGDAIVRAYLGAAFAI